MTNLERARMHAAQAVNRAEDASIPASSHSRSVIECVQGHEKLHGHAKQAHLLLRDDVAEARYHWRQIMSLIDAKMELGEEFDTAREIAADGGDGR